MEFLSNFDNQLFLAINNLPHLPIFNRVFLFFSLNPLIIWIALAIIPVALSPKKIRAKLLFQIITSAVLSLFIATIVLKPIFARPRPDISNGESVVIVSEQPALFSFANKYSFPSGHASVVVAVSFILAKSRKKYASVFYAVSFLTAFSRIYLGKHYPSDILAGVLIGFIIGWFVRFSVSKRRI